MMIMSHWPTSIVQMMLITWGGIVFVVHVTTMYILASFYVCGSHQSIFTGYAAVAWNYLVLLVGV
jgi:hypothetical protein